HPARQGRVQIRDSCPLDASRDLDGCRPGRGQVDERAHGAAFAHLICHLANYRGRRQAREDDPGAVRDVARALAGPGAALRGLGERPRTDVVNDELVPAVEQRGGDLGAHRAETDEADGVGPTGQPFPCESLFWDAEWFSPRTS